MQRLWLAIAILVPLAGQPVLRLKTGELRPAVSRMQDLSDSRIRPERVHLVVQFQQMPGPSERALLQSRGARILEFVPDHAYIVVAATTIDLSDLDLAAWGELDPLNKISPLLSQSPDALSLTVLAEFHRDVDSSTARALVWAAGGEVIENPDLAPTELLIRATWENLQRLAEFDGVSYVFPASSELQQRTPVMACQSGIVSEIFGSNLATAFGEGWDGPGRNAANLSYYYQSLTTALPAAAVRSEIERAMAAWSRVARVSFASTNSSRAARSIDILFGRNEHGDGNPFDGPGRVLAHTYYPPPNPESIAGDMHFDLDENWRIGADVDVFSVALHELGHALGLGHNDDPTSVMYPYYRRYADLRAADVTSVQNLYAARTETPDPGGQNPSTPSTPTTPAGYQVSIKSPTSARTFQTEATSLTVAGTVTPASGLLRVEWRNTTAGRSGIAQGTSSWVASSIGLQPGLNLLQVSAVPRTGSPSSTVLEVTRGVSTGRDTTGPSITITSPAQTVVTTSAASIIIRGTARDNVGVTGITWTNSVGASGTASGSTSWITTPIALSKGTNVITIRAIDAAANQSWRTLTVTRR